MFNDIVLAFTVAIFLTVFCITILKKDFLKHIYTSIKNYAYKILYIVILILLIFLITVQILNYLNINIFK